jgi:hypothetical protein
MVRTGVHLSLGGGSPLQTIGIKEYGLKPASLVLTACGIGLIVGAVLLASYLVPYRTRFAVSPPAFCHVNVWGSAIHQEPAEALVSWINWEVPSTMIAGVPVTYRLDFIRVEDPGNLQARFVMQIQGTSPAARNATGQAIADYFKRVDSALLARGLRLEGGYVSDSPRLDKASDTITWDQPLWVIVRP